MLERSAISMELKFSKIALRLLALPYYGRTPYKLKKG